MPPLPELDGVSFRTFAGASDYAHLARVIRANALGEENDRVETPRRSRQPTSTSTGARKARDFLVAENDATPAGNSRVGGIPSPPDPTSTGRCPSSTPSSAAGASATPSSTGTRRALREIAAEHEAEVKRLELGQRSVAAVAAAVAKATPLCARLPRKPEVRT